MVRKRYVAAGHAIPKSIIEHSNIPAKCLFMKGFVQGEARAQMSLLPECLDDYVAEDNPIRVVEAFVDSLDLES